jgi:hypothetical protein
MTLDELIFSLQEARKEFGGEIKVGTRTISNHFRPISGISDSPERYDTNSGDFCLNDYSHTEEVLVIG